MEAVKGTAIVTLPGSNVERRTESADRSVLAILPRGGFPSPHWELMRNFRENRLWRAPGCDRSLFD